MNDPRLDTLLHELRRTRRTRRLRGGAVVACALTLLIVTPVVLLSGHTAPNAPTPQAPSIVKKATPPAPDPSDSPSPEHITPVPRPSLIAVSHQTTPSRVQRIDDDELLDTLNESGRRTGLIRTGGEVILDAELLTKSDDTDVRDQSGVTPPSPTA